MRSPTRGVKFGKWRIRIAKNQLPSRERQKMRSEELKLKDPIPWHRLSAFTIGTFLMKVEENRCSGGELQYLGIKIGVGTNKLQTARATAPLHASQKMKQIYFRNCLPLV